MDYLKSDTSKLVVLKDGPRGGHITLVDCRQDGSLPPEIVYATALQDLSKWSAISFGANVGDPSVYAFEGPPNANDPDEVASYCWVYRWQQAEGNGSDEA